jgi:hypothetical protein
MERVQIKEENLINRTHFTKLRQQLGKVIIATGETLMPPANRERIEEEEKAFLAITSSILKTLNAANMLELTKEESVIQNSYFAQNIADLLLDPLQYKDYMKVPFEEFTMEKPTREMLTKQKVQKIIRNDAPKEERNYHDALKSSAQGVSIQLLNNLHRLTKTDKDIDYVSSLGKSILTKLHWPEYVQQGIDTKPFTLQGQKLPELQLTLGITLDRTRIADMRKEVMAKQPLLSQTSQSQA